MEGETDHDGARCGRMAPARIRVMSYTRTVEERLRRFDRYSRVELGSDDEMEAFTYQYMMAALDDGTPYYWSPEMCELLDRTVLTVPGEWTLRVDRLPTPYGFCLFGRPLTVATKERIEKVHAIAWQACLLDQEHEEFVLFVYGFIEDVVNGAGQESAQVSVVGDHSPLATMAPDFFDQDDLAGTHSTASRRGKSLLSSVPMLVAAAAFEIMAQRIASVESKQLDRATRRRLEREGEVADQEVRVVYLRRMLRNADGTGTPQTVDWSHRWMVSPHWRRQWMPALKTHELRLIAAYMKGPEDKPLKAPKASIYKVMR